MFNDFSHPTVKREPGCKNTNPLQVGIKTLNRCLVNVEFCAPRTLKSDPNTLDVIWNLYQG